MVRLNLESINTVSPYELTATHEGRCYSFVTDYGVIYSVSFLEDDLMYNENVYQFIIANVNNKKSPRDSKLRKTIIEIIYAFFEEEQNTLLYICETGDGKQNMRGRLFEYWFNSSIRKSEFVFYSAVVKDAEGISNYTAIISRIDNPNLSEVINEFTNTVVMLNQKP